MRLLSVESSAKAASVALSEDGRLISQYFSASQLTHSKTLLKMAEDMLTNQELSMQDIDAVAVAIGPGSFTGVRIGVAAAKGLCWGADKPAIGVSTLEAMAYQGIDRAGSVICACMDARRSEIYNALFETDGENLVRLCEDRAVPIDIIVEEAKNSKKNYFFLGDGAKLCYNRFAEEGIPCTIAPEPMLLQTAWGVSRAAIGKQAEDAQDLTPRYLRLSQAERERNERLRREKKNTED